MSESVDGPRNEALAYCEFVMKMEKLSEFLSQGDSCVRMCDYISNYSNPVRLKILCKLADGKASVNELVEATSERQSTVSQQLKHLTLGGFLSRKRDGNRVFYSILDPRVTKTLEFFVSIASDPSQHGRIL